MTAVFPQLSAATYPRHSLHDSARPWPETNCYCDLFIETLHTLGREPAAAFGMSVAQDFEGDQFTFFKIPSADLEAMFGLDVQELSIYRPLVDHVEEQLARGRLILVEVDAYHLADTRGITYRTEHSKTTIGINIFDRSRARLGYFHNAGYFEAEGSDVEALLGFGSSPRPELPPFCEFVKIVGPGLHGETLAGVALERFAGHWARRPRANPVDSYRATLTRHLDWLEKEPPCSFHPYAFNTTRQFGANMSLLGAHLAWLDRHAGGDFGNAAVLCERMATGAKTFQFLLARALARKRFDKLDPALDAIARDYDAAMAAITSALRVRLLEKAPALVPASS
jgi:Domain of unknown function (DUF1839)